MNEGFVFYKSFADAVDALPAEQYKIIVQALCKYAIYGEAPEDLDPFCLAMFTLMKPQVDANNKRREAGRKGGEASTKQNEANAKQTEANVKQTEASTKQNEAKEKDKDKVKDKVKALEKEKTRKEKDALAERDFSEPVRAICEKWLRFKREKGQGYKPTGVESFLNKVEKEIKAKGEEAVIKALDDAMSNNYQGWFAKGEQKPKTVAFDADAYLRERMLSG